MSYQLIVYAVTTRAEQATLIGFLLQMYYTLMIVIFIIAALFKAILIIVIDPLFAFEIFSMIGEAFMLLLLLLMYSSLELVVETLLAFLIVFGDSVYRTAVDVVLTSVSHIEIDYQERLTSLFSSAFNFTPVIPWTIKIIIGTGSTGLFAKLKKGETAPPSPSG